MNIRFLLARLHMDSPKSQPTVGDIKQALQNLPQGMEGLDETYDQAMKRIEAQEEGYRGLAKQVLAWVTHAKRALYTAEVQHALAVKVGMAELDEDYLPDVETLGSVCAGLVTIDKESDVIRLVHYTTQEYFKRTQNDLFPRAESEITTTCVTYLSFNVFKSGFCQTDDEFEKRLQSVSWFTGAPCLFHRFDLVVGGRRLPFSLPRIQLRILGSLSAGDS